MIYRVEFFKDGTVASCAEVESQLCGGGLVCYVEAQNKSEAIKSAKTQFQIWHARSIASTVARGMCRQCKNTPARQSRTLCQACADRHKARKLELAEIRKLPNAAEVLEARARSIAIAREERRREAHAKALELARTLADARWDEKTTLVNKSDRSLMRQVLRAYDRDPVGFRDWVLRMLGEEKAVAAE